MCGCFFWKKKKCKDIKKEIEIADISEDSSLDGDIRPGSTPLIITKKDELSDSIKTSLKSKSMLWGIPTKDRKRIINARVESVLEKPLFYDGIRNNRCVIPALSFYEWNKDNIKVTFSKKDDSIIYLAGFFIIKNNTNYFVILTTEANNSVIDTHKRMPLFFEANKVNEWILESNIKELLSLKMPELNNSQSCKQLCLDF